jgi:hypothetical protein
MEIDKPGREYRWLQTSGIRLYSKQQFPVSVALDVAENNNNPNVRIYTLLLKFYTTGYKLYFQEQSMLLMKHEDGSLTELASLDEEESAHTGSTWIGKNLYDNNTATVRYHITEEQIKKIIQLEVVKLRIETALALNDMDIETNSFSSTIRDQYLLILENLAVKKTLYSDF